MEPVEGYGRPGVMRWLSESTRSHSTGGVFYGWRLIVIGLAVILLGRELGAELSAATWVNRLSEDFGIGPPWHLVAIAGSVIGWLLSLYIAGRGVDRFGPKRMVQIGLPLAGLAVLLAAVPALGLSQAQFSVMSALAMIAAYVPAITILNNWFRNRLALALALMLFGAVVGEIFFDFVLAALLLVMDWRILTLLCGAAIAVAAWPLARLVRNQPEDWGEQPDGFAPAPAAGVPDYSWREAVRSRQFWTLMAAGSCVAVASMIARVYDWPFIYQSSATFEAIDKLGSYETLASPVGILLGGLACYRFPVRHVLFAIAIAQAVGIVLLLSGFGPTLLGSVLALAAASGMAVAPGIAAVGIYFGRRSFGAIIVTAFFVEDVASNGLLPLAGYSTSISVGYVPMFVGAAVVSLVGAVLFWMLGQPRLPPSQSGGEPVISC